MSRSTGGSCAYSEMIVTNNNRNILNMFALPAWLSLPFNNPQSLGVRSQHCEHHVKGFYIHDGMAVQTNYGPTRLRRGDSSPEVLELYRERTNSTKSHNSDQCRGALSIQRLEGGRCCLRRTRRSMEIELEVFLGVPFASMSLARNEQHDEAFGTHGPPS